jgi:hypothetical protein
MNTVNYMINKLQKRIEEVVRLKNIRKKQTVLVIQQLPTETTLEVNFPSLRESIMHIIVFLEIGNLDTLETLYPVFKNKFDYILFDNDKKIKNSEELLFFSEKYMSNENIFYYSDLNTWADSSISFLNHTINGIGLLHDLIITKFKLCDNFIFDHDSYADAIIGTTLMNISTDVDMIKYVNEKTKIYDVGIGNFSTGFLDEARKIGAELFRIDIRAGISSTIINILETDFLINKLMGITNIENINIVAGGILGSKNAVVVDNILKPSYVLGIADGLGRFKVKLNKQNQKDIELVNNLIKNF